MGVAAVVVLAATATVAAGSGAQAAPAPHAVASAPGAPASGAVRSTFTVPAGVGAVSTTFGADRVDVVRSPNASPRTTITCTLTVNAPTFIRTLQLIDARASLNCTQAVQSLSMTVGIYSNGLLRGQTPSSDSGQASLAGSTDIYYSSGAYQTGGTGSVTYPAGFTPPTGSIPLTYSLTSYL